MPVGVSGGNGVAALGAQIASAPKAPLPYLTTLEAVFATNLRSVGVATGVSASVSALGARGAASENAVAFAEPSPPIALVAHEVAHVLQHRQGTTSADAELEAAGAAQQLRGGSRDTFSVQARPGADVQLDTGPGPQPDPGSRPPRLESPFAAAIQADNATAVPGSAGHTVTLQTAGETTTVTIEDQIVSAELVTAYAVPLEDTFATPQDAAAAQEQQRQGFGALFWFAPPPPATPAPSKPPPAKPPATAPPAANVDVKNTTTSDVPASGDVVYDLAGTPIPLVERAAGWGITYEFTKLAVGAGSCGVLKTESGGYVVLDAGVRLTRFGTADTAVANAVMNRFRDLVVTSTGGRAPIDLKFSHTHLDHTALFERLSSEYVIGKITINTVQLRDAGFQAVLGKLAENQQQAHLKAIKDSIRDTARADFEESNGELEAGAKDRAFEQYLDAQARVKLKDTPIPPVEVEVHVPAGTGGGTIKVKLPGIEIVPREVSREGNSYVARDASGETILDLAFGKQAESGPAETPSGLRDKLESNYVLKLPNDDVLVIVPDIRGGDIAKNGQALVAAVDKLGGGVALLEIGHHFQKGFHAAEAGTRIRYEKATGLMYSSQLEQLSRVITKIAAKAEGAFAITSGDIGRIDPAVLKFLDLCGVTLVPTVGGTDTQFIAAVTAKGEEIKGFTGGAAVDMKSGALLQRADMTLDKLRDELGDANRAETEEVREIEADAATQVKELQAQRASLQGQLDLADDAIKRKDYGGSTRAQRRSERKALSDQIKETDQQIKQVGEQAKQDIAEGPARAKRVAIVAEYNEVMQAKEALLAKLKKVSGKVKGRRALEPDALAKDLKPQVDALEKVVDREFDALKSRGEFKVITETSLVLLGKTVKRTAENAELIDAWREAYEARVAAQAEGAPIDAQVAYTKKLERLREVIKKRPDIADQKAVDHELALIDEQIQITTDALQELAKTKGRTTTDIDPLTGATVEKTVISEETAVEAAERQKLVTVTDTPAADQPQTEAKPTEAEAEKPKPTAYEKFDKGTRWVGDKVGRGMGALMMFQNIKAGTELIERYERGEANLPETGLGVAKSAYGISIGYRMLRNVHVSAGEFLLVSAMEVGQALLADYSSTAEFDTAVTYALISAGLNAALFLIGSWLMTLGPFGMIAGFIVMALGDTILNALGVKEWLAKMFDPRPDENIDLDRDLQKGLEKYAFAIGSAELKVEQDPMLRAYGASDPKAVREAVDKQLADRREDLLRQEVEIVESFEAAYKRARKGYMGLKWLDDQRARFVSLFLKVHHNDPIPEGGTPYVYSPHWYSSIDFKFFMSRQTVLDRLKGTEEVVTLSNATEDDIRGMEQWTKLDDRISDLTGLLYHDEVNPENYEYVDWMKVNEKMSLVEQMLANARYRLHPDAQGAHRAAPLLADGPAKTLYEQLVLAYENKVDVLRERVLDMSMGTGAATGIKIPGKGLYWDHDMFGLPELRYDVGTYYEPEYGDVSRSPTEAELLPRVQRVVSYYAQHVVAVDGEWSELPEGVTLSTLKSDVDVIRTYRNALTHDAGYKAYIFDLQAARTAALGMLERAHRYLDASPTAKDPLANVDAAFREAERERTDEYGHYFLDELPQLEETVGMAHVSAAAQALGESPEAPQMTAMEHVAAGDKKLESLHLSTLRDRLIKAGVVIPADPSHAIRRLFALRDDHSVLVGIKPDAELRLESIGLGAVWYGVYDVIPINDAAMTFFGEHTTLAIPLYKLVPVTLNDLNGATAITNTPLEPEPELVTVVRHWR